MKLYPQFPSDSIKHGGETIGLCVSVLQEVNYKGLPCLVLSQIYLTNVYRHIHNSTSLLKLKCKLIVSCLLINTARQKSYTYVWEKPQL